MEKITGDQPAMPLTDATMAHDEDFKNCRGLTLRQHFAAMALQGLLANPELLRVGTMGKTDAEEVMQSFTQDAVMAADLLIDELNKPKQ